MTWALWVPGRFSLTNAMLDNLRAAGFYQGRSRLGKRLRAGAWDAFAVETSAIRLATKVAAVREFGALVSPLAPRVSLDFTVFGHRKHDPDAWYLLGKAVTDGLRDAGVLASDRFGVFRTSGRVLQNEFEEVAEVLGAPVPRLMKEPGVWVLIFARSPS